jgi:hypothetical protein
MNMKPINASLVALTLCILSSLACLSLANGEKAQNQSKPISEINDQQTDRFLGQYNPDAHYYGDKLITITKDGDFYRMSDKHYKDYRFVKKSDYQLEDEKGILGTITLGKLTFEGDKESPQIVLRISFCYNAGLLFKKNKDQ